MAQSLFTSQVPATPQVGEASTGLTLGTIIRVDAAGQITHGRWRFPTNTPAGGQTVTFVLYNYTTQTELRRAAFASPTYNDWNTVSLTSYTVAAGDFLLAAVYLLPGGANVHYPSTGAFFATGLDNGDLYGPAASEVTTGNGRFGSGDAFPTSSFNSSCYFVDVVFELEGAADTTPPSTPTGLATTAVGATTADLTWNASTDNVGVTGYEVVVVGP